MRVVIVFLALLHYICALHESRMFNDKPPPKLLTGEQKGLLESLFVNYDKCGMSIEHEDNKSGSRRVKRIIDEQSNSHQNDSLTPHTVVTHGFDAKNGQFPWQVSLQMKSEKNHFCGGTIISKCHIMTAAHCIAKNDDFELKPSEIQITYGSNKNNVDKKDNDRSVKVVEAKRLIKHYHFEKIKYDIAIIQVKEEFQFDDHAQPACLPLEQDCSFTGPATISGFGLVDEENRTPTHTLKGGNVRIIPKTECERTLNTNHFDPISMLCQEMSDTGACYGDSGGPLISRDERDRATLRGVTSWVLGSCGSEHAPATVFTDICHYLPWTLKVLQAYPCS